MTLAGWKGCVRPERRTIVGRYARLEPLNQKAHAQTLFEASTKPGAEESFRYLFESAPSDFASFSQWIERASSSDEQLFFAVVDAASGRAEGRQALMRIDAAHGVIEVGSIFWGPSIARTRVATEAFFLFADCVFGLGYRRLEWKCNNLNEASKKAALRFGFQPEGVFRQHMVVKGENRDTAWFSMLDGDWIKIRTAYQDWLAPANFDELGQQRASLRF